MTGRVVHFEIPADDLDRARAFYREAFGWQVQEMPDGGYTLLMTGPVSEEGRPTDVGFINGGMTQRQPPNQAPNVVVEVDDIDQALEKVAALGGSAVTGKLPVGEMGFTAYVTDSEGNVVGLWQNAT